MVAKTIRGAGGGSGGSTHTPVDAPDNLNSKAYARIIDLISEGEIQGFALGYDNALQCIFLDQTPIANSDGSLNFQNVQVDSRSGTQTQTYMPGFPDVENEISIGVELKSGTPFIREFTDLDMSAIGVRLSVPNGLQSENASNGDINGFTVAYTIEIQADTGPYVLMVESSFTGKASTNYERSHRIDLPPATTGWNVRVTRTTANADSSTISDTTDIVSMTEIVDGKFSYPNSAIVGLVLDASQFSSIPTRSFHVLGRIIQVPSNYDPVGRTYTGAWDGSFKPAYSNNPAWVYWDMATNPRYGLGNQLTSAQVNKWALYAIGQYCDGMVPDGKGGTEPRFTCNLYLQTQADAYKVMSDLASVFRGISFYLGNAISASSDMPSDPVYTYTAANVVNGLFTYAGTARTTRYNVALVSWNDPSNFYSPATEYVPDQAGIARYGIQQTQVTAVGCTSQGQAQRVGNWILTTSRLEGETVTYGVGLEGMPCSPGQIIRIADPNRMGRRVAGRISASTNNSITVDKLPSVINVGDTVTVTLPTGITESHTVSALAGNVITVSAAFSQNPVAQSIWLVESTELTAQTFRVLTRKDNGDMTYTITAARNIAGKYDEIDNGTIIQIPPTSVLLPKVQGAPTTVTLLAIETAGVVNSATVLNISWPAVTNATSYVVEYRYNNGEWMPLPSRSGLSVDVQPVQPGDYMARVSAVNAAGNTSAPTLSATYTVIDQTVVPESVSAAQAAAAAASASAATANAALAQIASDGVLTPAEKSTVIQDTNVILAEQAGIDEQAAAYSIVAEKTDYDNAVTALSTYLATLTAPTLWDDLTGNTNIVSSAFRAAFSNVYTTRQTLLNTIYAGAQSLADNAQATANSTSNSSLVNLSFSQGMFGWTAAGDATSWYAETGTNGPNGGTSTYVVHKTDTTTSSLDNVNMVSVYPGQVIKATGQCKGLGTPNGAAALFIAWYDINKTFISSPTSNQVTGNGQFQLALTATAPVNAAFASLGPSCGFAGASPASGYYSFANFAWNYQPSTLDEVPDGPTFVKSMQQIGSGAAWNIDNGLFQTPGPTGVFAVPGWNARSGCQIYCQSSGGSPAPSYGSTYLILQTVSGAANSADSAKSFPVVPGDSLSIVGLVNAMSGASSNVQINFYSATGSFVGQIASNSVTASAWQQVSGSGKVPATAAIAQVTLASVGGGSYFSGFNFVQVTVNDVRVAGSGSQIGDQRNLPAVNFSNYGSGWSGMTCTYTATTTTATVSISAATLQAGSVAIAYNASSVTIGGSAGVTFTYYLYYQDPTHAGGAQTLRVSTSQVGALNNNGDVLVCAVTVTFPTSGSGGGSGLPPCVSVNAWVKRRRNGKIERVRASTVRVGDELRLMNPATGEKRWGRVSYSVRRKSLGVRLVSDVGGNRSSLTCSIYAPIGCSDGTFALAPAMKGREVAREIAGRFCAGNIVDVIDVGEIDVQHITCENDAFLAGDEPGLDFAHHNLKPPG